MSRIQELRPYDQVIPQHWVHTTYTQVEVDVPMLLLEKRSEAIQVSLEHILIQSVTI